MKKVLVVVVLGGLAMSGGPAVAIPRPVNEGGDTRPCVTYSEYEVVNIQTPLRKANRIFDTKGKRLHHRAGGEIAEAYGLPVDLHTPSGYRSYPVCPEPTIGITSGTVVIQFKRTSPRHRVISSSYNDSSVQ